MKKYINNLFATLVVMFMSAATTIAQETKKLDIDIDTNPGDASTWYTQPWVWIVGGAVFLLLLVALMRGGNKS